MERNPAADPFTPGSGYPPPFLAGRETEKAAITDAALPRLKAGRPARPLLFTGIRGVGKTAVLTVARRAASELRLPIVRLEASRRGALLEDMAFQLDELLTTLSSRRDATRHALEELAEFKVGVQVAGSGVEVGGRRREPNIGSLESRFRRLLSSVAAAAADADRPLVVVIDELQQGPGDLLGPILTALHQANQDEIPVGVFAAGLPYTEDWVTEHVTYGGRMFDHHRVGLLDDDASAQAFAETLSLIPNESFAPDALEGLVRLGQGVPYFIQEHGSATWRNASDDPISLNDVLRGEHRAGEAISAFYRQRLAEASPREAEYLAAVARLGDGQQRSADIADELEQTPAAVAGYRARLIRNKGLLVEPARGLVEFALPGMGEWLRANPDEVTSTAAAP